MRRLLVVLFAVFAIAFVATIVVGREIHRFANTIEAVPLPDPSPEARRLHASATLVDLHADPLLWNRDLSERSTVGHVDLPRLREAGVAIQVFGVVTRVPIGINIERNSSDATDAILLLALTNGWPFRTYGSLTERALHQTDELAALAAASDGRFVPIASVEHLDGVLEAREQDASILGAVLGIEGAHALDGEVENLTPLFAAGVRMIGLAHFFDNAFAGSAHGEAKGGLTPKGRDLVAEMDRRGVILDLAHASAKTIEDALAITKNPPVVSHTGVRGTCDNQRNLSDDQIRAIAAKGGILGIGVWETAVCGLGAEPVARAIRHVVDLVGDDHAALGTDFDGAVETGFDVTGLPTVTQALLDEGLSPESIRKILGGNAIRVFREVLPGELREE